MITTTTEKRDAKLVVSVRQELVDEFPKTADNIPVIQAFLGSHFTSVLHEVEGFELRTSLDQRLFNCMEFQGDPEVVAQCAERLCEMTNETGEKLFWVTTYEQDSEGKYHNYKKHQE